MSSPPRVIPWRVLFVLAAILLLAGGPQHPRGDTMGEMLADPRWVPAHALMLAGFILLTIGLTRLAPLTTGARTRYWIRLAALATGFQALEMAVHTAAVVDRAALAAGGATPTLTTHLALSVIAYPLFGAAMIGLILAGTREASLGSPWIGWLGIIGALGHGAAAPLTILLKAPGAAMLFPLLMLLAIWLILVAFWPDRNRALSPVVVLLLAGLGGDRIEAQTPRFDVVIRGGRVVDGSGSPAFAADIGISGGRITAIARDRLPPRSGRTELDAKGLVVSPGFIDHHAHISTNIHERPLAENFLFQGITTIVASLHSGDVPWPLAAYMDSLKTAPNVGFFCGHSWIRREVLGLANRAPNGPELDRMRGLTDQCMRDGALGLSTGLLYVPANYAATEEIIELARVAARHGGIYVTHMRDEARGLLASVREAIRIGEEAGLPVQINHHKAAGAGQFGWSTNTLALIDSARARGLDVTHDLYPYAAGSTGSGVLFPQWALAGGADSLRARVDNPTVRRRLEAEMLERMRADWAGEDLARIQFRELYSNRSYDGKTMADLARDRGLPVSAATGVQLAIELQLQGGFSAIYHMMDERDVVAIMKHPLAMFETDGDPIGYGQGFPHPRSYGAFARVLARYVREQKVLTLEDAIRRMTSLSAAQIGQPDLGLIQQGRRADIVMFDPERIADLATYQDPHRFSVGMVHILVNGEVVLRDGSLTGAKPGRVLKGPARPRRTS